MKEQNLPPEKPARRSTHVRQFFRLRIALTQEHGSWVFLFSPMLIGVFAAGRWTAASGWFVCAALAVFLFRHPLTLIVKSAAGRRGRQDLPAAYFWMAVYGTLAVLSYTGLSRLGFGWIAILMLPGLPILAWHLRLVTRREERRQIGLQIIASGVLALAAPGAYWIGQASYDPVGWWLWLLTWLQSAGSITYAALRLEQRSWPKSRPAKLRFRPARRALIYTTFNTGFALILGLIRVIPLFTFLPFAIQMLETLYGSLRPAGGIRPAAIGMRQLAVSVLFTVVFVWVWG